MIAVGSGAIGSRACRACRVGAGEHRDCVDQGGSTDAGTFGRQEARRGPADSHVDTNRPRFEGYLTTLHSTSAEVRFIGMFRLPAPDCRPFLCLRTSGSAKIVSCVLHITPTCCPCPVRKIISLCIVESIPSIYL